MIEPVTLAASIAGGSSFLGGLFSNSENKRESARNREFQEAMSSTAYSRARADMLNAGLNPILMASQGGASTAAGSVIPMQNPAKDVPQAVSSAVQMAKSKSEIAAINSQTNLNLEKINSEKTSQALQIANSGLATANTGLAGANTSLAMERFETQKNITQQERVRIDTAFANLGKTRMESIQAEAAADKAINQGKIDQSEVGELLGWLARAKELGVGLDTVLQLLSKKKPGGKFPHIPNASNGFKTYPGNTPPTLIE